MNRFDILKVYIKQLMLDCEDDGTDVHDVMMKDILELVNNDVQQLIKEKQDKPLGKYKSESSH